MASVFDFAFSPNMHLEAITGKVVIYELCCRFEVIHAEEDERTNINIEG